MTWILLKLLRAYQLLVSPALHCLLPARTGCRFLPTCSQYAMDALRSHGLWRGSWLALRRLARCHPWGGFGYDPVPSRSSLITRHASRPVAAVYDRRLSISRRISAVIDRRYKASSGFAIASSHRVGCRE